MGYQSWVLRPRWISGGGRHDEQERQKTPIPTGWWFQVISSLSQSQPWLVLALFTYGGNRCEEGIIGIYVWMILRTLCIETARKLQRNAVWSWWLTARSSGILSTDGMHLVTIWWLSSHLCMVMLVAPSANWTRKSYFFLLWKKLGNFINQGVSCKIWS